MFSVKKVFAALLMVLVAGAGASAQTPGNFVQGAVLCANFGCSSQAPVNPMGLNEAFAAKADYPGIFNGNNVWNGSNQFTNFVNVPTPAAADNSFAAANTSWVRTLLSNGNFVTGNFGPSTTAPAQDGQILHVFNSSLRAKDVYLPFSVMNGEQYDAIRAVVDFEAISVGSLTQVNGISAYMKCNVATAEYPDYGACVGVQGFVTVTKVGAIGWGSAAVVQDTGPATVGTASTRTAAQRNEFLSRVFGRDIRDPGKRSLIGTEIDTGVDDNTGTTEAVGLLVGLQGTGSSAGSLRGIVINAVATSLKYGFGIDCGGGAMSIACLNVGAQSNAVASRSQLIAFEYNRSPTVSSASTLFASATGGLSVGTVDGTAPTTALDLSGIAPSGCTLLIAQGCAVGPNGNFFAQTIGTPSAPNFRLATCGVCGLYAPASGQIGWAANGAPIMDFGATQPNTFSFDVNVSFGAHSAYGGGMPNVAMNFYSTYGTPDGTDNVHFQASKLVFDNWSKHVLDYNLTYPGYWTFDDNVVFIGSTRWTGQPSGTPPALNSSIAQQIIGPATSGVTIDFYAYNGNTPGVQFFASNGALGSETTLGSGYNTGLIAWRGWTGSGYGNNQATIRSFTPTAWTPGTSQPMHLRLMATPVGAISQSIGLQVMGGVVIGASTNDPGAGKLALTGSTFANLIAVAGTLAYITDGIASGCADTTCTTFGTNVTAGGGALPKLVWYNGANWKLFAP